MFQNRAKQEKLIIAYINRVIDIEEPGISEEEKNALITYYKKCKANPIKRYYTRNLHKLIDIDRYNLSKREIHSIVDDLMCAISDYNMKYKSSKIHFIHTVKKALVRMKRKYDKSKILILSDSEQLLLSTLQEYLQSTIFKRKAATIVGKLLDCNNRELRSEEEKYFDQIINNISTSRIKVMLLFTAYNMCKIVDIVRMNWFKFCAIITFITIIFNVTYLSLSSKLMFLAVLMILKFLENIAYTNINEYCGIYIHHNELCMNVNCKLPVYEGISDTEKNTLVNIVVNKSIEDIRKNKYLKIRRILRKKHNIRILVRTNQYIYRAISKNKEVEIKDYKFIRYVHPIAKFALKRGFFKNLKAIFKREFDYDREVKDYVFYIELW